jgi:hypothetical protein
MLLCHREIEDKSDETRTTDRSYSGSSYVVQRVKLQREQPLTSASRTRVVHSIDSLCVPCLPLIQQSNGPKAVYPALYCHTFPPVALDSSSWRQRLLFCNSCVRTNVFIDDKYSEASLNPDLYVKPHSITETTGCSEVSSLPD